jgi:Na+/melibiose symporter-like transporter
MPATTLLAYGVFGIPLAMAALPLYVHLPKFYGDHLGVDLALLGGVLLALRLADGAIDPLLGVLSDRGGPRKRWLALAAPTLALGIAGLFMPLPRGKVGLVVWLAKRWATGLGRDAAAVTALAIVYALGPCVLKLGAGVALLWIRRLA